MKNEIVIFEDQGIKLEVNMKDETVWLNQGQMAKLFALERNEGLKAIIGAIYQSYDGNDLYPTIEEKAANFLYLITKNHTFIDGNKRIDNNTLVAVTLLIAESNPKEKDTLIDLVVNFLTTLKKGILFL